MAEITQALIIMAIIVFVINSFLKIKPMATRESQICQEIIEILNRDFSDKVDEKILSDCISSINTAVSKYPWNVHLMSVFEVVVANMVVNAHYDQLKRDYEIGVTVDGYGIQDESGWDRTLQKVVDSIAVPVFMKIAKDAANRLTKINQYEKEKFLTETINSENATNLLQANLRARIDYIFRERYESEPQKEFMEILNRNFSNGIEYEHAIAKTINLYSDGWSAEVTKASGDQGLDILARHPSGVTAAIQAKLYSSPVGNKAVQEVISAMGFYKTNFAAVVTNSRYTESAKQLASSHSIELLHHNSILDYLGGVVRK